MRLEGKLKSNEWTNNEGKKRTAYEIVLNKPFGSCLAVPSYKKGEEITESEETDFLCDAEEATETNK